VGSHSRCELLGVKGEHMQCGGNADIPLDGTQGVRSYNYNKT